MISCEFCEDFIVGYIPASSEQLLNWYLWSSLVFAFYMSRIFIINRSYDILPLKIDLIKSVVGIASNHFTSEDVCVICVSVCWVLLQAFTLQPSCMCVLTWLLALVVIAYCRISMIRFRLRRRARFNLHTARLGYAYFDSKWVRCSPCVLSFVYIDITGYGQLVSVTFSNIGCLMM